MDNMEQPGSDLNPRWSPASGARHRIDVKAPLLTHLCVAMSRGFYGAYHYGLRGLPFSPYHPYDVLRLFLFNRFIAFSCFSLLLSPLLK